MNEKMISLSKAELELLFVNLQEIVADGQTDITIDQLVLLLCQLGRPTIPDEF